MGERVGVIGSRNYIAMHLVRSYLAALPKDTVIVTGGARGVDSYAERVAKEQGKAVEVLPADWTAHGKAAGPIRNTALVAASDRVIAFWDGKSRGTYDVIAKARKAGKSCEVVTRPQDEASA